MTLEVVLRSPFTLQEEKTMFYSDVQVQGSMENDKKRFGFVLGLSGVIEITTPKPGNLGDLLLVEAQA